MGLTFASDGGETGTWEERECTPLKTPADTIKSEGKKQVISGARNKSILACPFVLELLDIQF